MLPGVPSVDNGSTPAAGGFLDLATAGVAPTFIGDEDILQFTSSPFQFNGETWTSFGIVSNGYLVVGDSSVFDIVRDPPTGLSPARPNNIIAPLWTDLEGTDAPGVRVAVFSAGPANARSSWIVVQWNVEVQGSEQAEVFQVWFGLSNDATPAQDVSFSYGTGSPTNPGQAFLVGAENKFGEGDMVATLPTQPQRVTSTGVTPGGTVSYTVDVTGNQPGGGQVRTELTASRMAGTAIARSNISVVAR
jgi:hypothetical protein